jgi:hypothetical protein
MGQFPHHQKAIKCSICCLNPLLIPNVTYEKWLIFEKVRLFWKVSHLGPKWLTLWKTAYFSAVLAQNCLLSKTGFLVNYLIVIVLIPIYVGSLFQEWLTFESMPFFKSKPILA